MNPDLILHNGTIWTVDPARPTAGSVAIEGSHLVGVGSDADVTATAGPDTKMIDLRGNLVLPGFVDAHTHFENAVNGFFHLRLNNTDDVATLLEQLAERVELVPEDDWITGGEWSATAGRAAAKSGDAEYHSFFPALEVVDQITPNRPVLLKRYDGAYLLNSYGMDLFHISRSTPDPSGGAYERDASGELTGVLLGTAGSRAVEMLPPVNRTRTMLGARAMMHQLNQLGIVGIHDIARVPQISERQTFQTNVERSSSDVTIFEELRASGDLTVRVNPILTLRTWTELEGLGITPGKGDDLIRYNALKMFVGGFLMFRGFRDNPEFSGSLSFRNRDEEQLRKEAVAADAAGWDIAAHVTGDRGHALVVGILEEANRVNPSRARRHRILHAWYPRVEEIQRAGALGVYGDITPYHLMREMSSLQVKLHADQLLSAFAWRDMIEAGWRVNIVSDWPGSFDGSHEAPLSPLENIFMAVTRQRRDGSGDVFHADQGLTTDEAIEAYTINPSRAAGEEANRGSVTPGKLADLVVLSRDIRTIPVAEIPDTRVVLTVFNGRIVYDALR